VESSPQGPIVEGAQKNRPLVRVKGKREKEEENTTEGIKSVMKTQNEIPLGRKLGTWGGEGAPQQSCAMKMIRAKREN